MAVLKLIPNGLTVSRILIAGVFPFLPQEWRLVAVIVALLTEFFDGYLARVWHCESDFGRMLDPVADKIFICVVAVMLVAENQITLWHLALIASRDVMVVVGGIIACFVKLGKDYLGVRPKLTGKIATTFQFAFLIAVYALNVVLDWLLYLTILASLISALDYFIRGVNALRTR